MMEKLPDELWIAICGELFASNDLEGRKDMKRVRRVNKRFAQAADVWLFCALPLHRPNDFDLSGDIRDSRSHAAKWFVDCTYMASSPRAGYVQEMKMMVPLLAVPDYNYSHSQVEAFMPRFTALKTLSISEYRFVDRCPVTDQFLRTLLNRADIAPKLQDLKTTFIPDFGQPLAQLKELSRKLGQLRCLTMKLDGSIERPPLEHGRMVEIVQMASSLEHLSLHCDFFDSLYPLHGFGLFRHSNIRFLDIDYCSLRGSELCSFLLQNQATLRTVSLSGVELEFGRWKTVFQQLRALPRLTRFDIEHLGYTEDRLSLLPDFNLLGYAEPDLDGSFKIDETFRSSSWLDFHALADIFRPGNERRITTQGCRGNKLEIEGSRCLQLCSLAEAKADRRKIGKLTKNKHV